MTQIRIWYDLAMVRLFAVVGRVARRSGAGLAAEEEDTEPVAIELFNAEQMERHGRALAGGHRIGRYRGADLLLPRLAANERQLRKASTVLTSAVRANRRIAPAGEWLLDNFYLIDEQIRTARRHLPRGYSRELPRLTGGISAGLPRVYDIAREAIAHADGRMDPESLGRFVASYQRVTVLKLGELWAIPIMLRLALIDNLRQAAARVAASAADKERATAWADWMIGVAQRDPKSLVLVVADMARSNPPMASAFVAELARRLQGQSAALALPLTWIEQRLAETGLTIEQVVQIEAQKQASAQVSISNSIGSLRLFAAIDWRTFVEDLSEVEHILRQDPAEVYSRMDFASRDQYRHVIERLARTSRTHEVDIAASAISLCREAATLAPAQVSSATVPDLRTRHVGYYLVGAGCTLLERKCGRIRSRQRALAAACGKAALFLYLGGVGLLTLGIAWLMLGELGGPAPPAWQSVPLCALLLVGCSHLAIALVNWVSTLVTTPKSLPRLDFSTGIAPDCRTLVVVPVMLRSLQDVAGLCEALEVRFLANRDAMLQFALLSDFLDASTEHVAGDEELLASACRGVAALNARYPLAACDSFLLLHRARSWNPQEGCWMGEERKRGKLAALNALIRDPASGAFSSIEGRVDRLAGIRFVITLDSDTRLPRDAARELVGTMAHPLNRAVYDPVRRRVVEGYGILQPRVAASLPSANRSIYARVFGSEAGINPYTRAVSDLYQDLFGEGSFIGKGIYEVDAFEQALAGQFPHNRILSHDLLEGCYARAGLLSDVLLFEPSPAAYIADMRRHHRWIRGDWQVGSWIFAHVPPAPDGGARNANPLSLLSRWKLLDNLRRSLTPAALVLLLLLGWLVVDVPGRWTATVLLLLWIPAVLPAMVDLFRKPEDLTLRDHVATTLDRGGDRALQALFLLASLLNEACLGVDAALRTTWRVCVSKRRLLQWTPSGSEIGGEDRLLATNARTLGPVALLGVALLIAVGLQAPAALPAALPILLLWLALPLLAYGFGMPLNRRELPLDSHETAFLRLMARRTWRFFETWVGPDDHWLPPDNFQEYPVAVLAHRTSPTNLGLGLLSSFSAYDLGYIEVADLLARTDATLTSMAGLERHLGHFYNWYDTRSRAPLPPLYVSTVDSGNLSAHLMTLRQGLLSLPQKPILGERWREGLHDTLQVLLGTSGAALPQIKEPLSRLQVEIGALAELQRQTAVEVHTALLQISVLATRLLALLHEEPVSESSSDVVYWAQRLVSQCAACLAELALLAPWVLQAALDSAMQGALEAVLLPTLDAVAQGRDCAPLAAEGALASGATDQDRAWIEEARRRQQLARQAAGERLVKIEALAALSASMADPLVDFLYDPGRRLLSIGYNVSERRQDPSFYDLLASEARLASFVAIAQGQIPQEHWYALGRLLTRAQGEPVLLSWSGSMFEYLMPLLVMPSYRNSLLDQTCRVVVARQIQYCGQRKVAWGISESGYNAVDVALNYQYRAFGVPGLGFKPGLADDLVITPYASALALMVSPKPACENLQRLLAEGACGDFGFYEAIDHSPLRMPPRTSSVLVRSYMAHHQGMILLSLASVIADRPMQKRFNADPRVKATTLLLQEQLPRAGEARVPVDEVIAVRTPATAPETPVRVIQTPDTVVPELQLLSNGHYHVMVTNAGGGYSRWKELGVTRWREDPTCDPWGSFCYLRDVDSGLFWSNAHQPTLRVADHYEAIFSEGRVEFRRSDLGYQTHTEIVVSPEDDVELRRLHITNATRARRTIEVTSYAEVLLAAPATDALHSAFSNLFIQTEIVSASDVVLCTRRPRSLTDPVPWMFHLMAVRNALPGTASFETDRARFIGRGRSAARPAAFEDCTTLSGSAGPVLDPIVSIRRRIVLEPQQTVMVDVVTGIGASRAAALELAAKYQDRHLADRAFDLSWTHSQVVLRQINASEADAQRYAAIAGAVIYAHAGLRAESSVLSRNRRGQSGLWGYAISGDLPLVLVQIADPANIDLVRQLVQAHAYWRLKGLAVDLVIWNEDQAGYRQQLHEQIMGLIAAGIEAPGVDKPGGIFVRRADQMSEEERILVQSVARAVFSDRRGSLISQLEGRMSSGHASRRRIAPHLQPRLKASHALRPGSPAPAQAGAARMLLLDNGMGGFSPDGREYVITSSAANCTPAPWVNVIANQGFGTVISESGIACTWSENAQQFRLSPWGNDPVTDAGGEAFYLRDEDSGAFWSPTPLPAPGLGTYQSCHGFGYSRFEHVESGISSELTVYVALDDPIKFSRVRIRNQSGVVRRISCTHFLEWVLGDLRDKGAMHVVTEVEAAGGALFARNPFNSDFPERTAFLDLDDPRRTVTGDRTEFIGRNGTLRDPDAMHLARLSGAVGAALDPCAALQSVIELEDGAEHEWIFRLGCARDAIEAGNLLARWQGPEGADRAFAAVAAYWLQTLGVIQVETPDPALDLLANGWLVYQTLACRFWGRSAYYQSGGAFGFRDQLQDVMALVHAEPGLTREHLLRCASRQFHEGDVQHWWHPYSGRGVRTQCSDDYLWLPLATCHYVAVTGDVGVLSARARFLEGRLLGPGEDSCFDQPGQSEDDASLYQHCVLALKHGLRFGAHGLPLMGSGDWNDGMNLVGIQGRGESVWLGFFLCEGLKQFSDLAIRQGDTAFAAVCRSEAAALQTRIEAAGWDGAWYRRAYFDDGSPLGSSSNTACQIDAIAQSWAVLSGAAPRARASAAMAAVDQRLVDAEHGLIALLTPPFDQPDLDPGYIRGYLPGVRENGGQYTHAAIWTVMAFAALGEHARCWELFDLINPLRHGATPAGIARYKVEPYVVAADVYGRDPHAGRGGWTWYTGSAGWMYRLITESLLGLHREGTRLRVTPLPRTDWPRFEVRYRFGNTHYHIVVLRDRTAGEPAQTFLDGDACVDGSIPLRDDGLPHQVEVHLGIDALPAPDAE